MLLTDLQARKAAPRERDYRLANAGGFYLFVTRKGFKSWRFPTTMISGPLAEAVGFSTFFLLVMLASVPSVIAAWKAPFPLNINDHQTSDDGPTLTIDDPTRISAGDRVVQQLAGRASMFAMFHLLAILIIDSWALGALRSAADPGIGAPAIGLMLNIGLKVVCSFYALRWATAARRAATAVPGCVYLANARGAIIVTIIGIVTSIAVAAIGYAMVLGR